METNKKRWEIPPYSSTKKRVLGRYIGGENIYQIPIDPEDVELYKKNIPEYCPDCDEIGEARYKTGNIGHVIIAYLCTNNHSWAVGYDRLDGNVWLNAPRKRF